MIAKNQELHAAGERSCRHVEFAIDNSRVRYEAGDHIGIFAQNKPAMVERIGKLLNVDLSVVIKLINLDGIPFVALFNSTTHSGMLPPKWFHL